MRTFYEAFADTAHRLPDNAFFAVPAKADRDYAPAGFEISYGAMLADVDRLAESYRGSGYGLGHRVALMLDNRPAHFLHYLALNRLGATIVPVNPDYLHHELAYLMEHSEADLAVVLGRHLPRMEKVAAERAKPLPVVVEGALPERLPAPLKGPDPGMPDRTTTIALIYTSGTTGRPKGCIIDNEYAFAVGRWYAELGGKLTLRPGRERIFVPLPVFHVNGGINTPAAMVLTGNCLIMPERFSPKTWWADLVRTRATGMHYLGVVPPILLKAPPCPEEKEHTVRFGLGAGLDPQLHRAFEERFGIPMVEVWGMTETGRFLADNHEPRRIDTRAFGRPTDDFLAKVVDENDREVPRGAEGELVVRWAGDDPRFGFFRGYLKDEAATAEAWRGGWFHTGDVVTQEPDGMLHFVERRKNIIRRSGENISAAEVENALVGHPAVARLAVIPVVDELRDEEVLACVVLADDHSPSPATAAAILDHGRSRLAYYKWPGWVVFLPDLPTTGTQKVQKHQLFPKGEDPRKHPGAVDLRPLKKRESVT